MRAAIRPSCGRRPHTYCPESQAPVIHMPRHALTQCHTLDASPFTTNPNALLPRATCRCRKSPWGSPAENVNAGARAPATTPIRWQVRLRRTNPRDALAAARHAFAHTHDETAHAHRGGSVYVTVASGGMTKMWSEHRAAHAPSASEGNSVFRQRLCFLLASPASPLAPPLELPE